ncbi:MAG: response regulator [Planctomycetota bacterium]|jgi:DNA-binding NarL/FixJ family response regulator
MLRTTVVKRAALKSPTGTSRSAPRANSGSEDEMKIRIVVADDNESLRDSLRDLFGTTDDIEVVAMAEDGHQALDLARAMKPDLVVMDIGMPRLNGIQATQRIIDELPDVKVIALSVHADKRMVALMLNAGASEYVLKDFAFEHLAGTIRATVAKQP